jgi:hypothetical protein
VIPKYADVEACYVPLGNILIGEDLPRDPDKVQRYVGLLTEHPDEDMEPIILQAAPHGMFRIINGHHRFVAGIIAGRPRLLAVVVST